METTARPRVVRKSRAGTTRSRGGCNTCRIRRVKCDERKPGCLRCEKFGRACDGYDVKKVCTFPGPLSKPPNRSRDLLPNSISSVAYPSKQPITIVFRDEQESRYFHSFISDTSYSLSGGYDTPLWNRIVLQACHDEPCILQIAIALSALDKARKSKQSKILVDTTSEIHNRYALQLYSKAIKSLQEVVSTRGHSLRTALIASLLIFCFENFHGDARLALTNVHRAVELMHHWLASNNKLREPGCSPVPDTVDNEIVAAFARLDLHLTSWIATPSPLRLSIHNYAVTEARSLPETFNSLNEAKLHFEHVVNRVFHYLKSIQFVKHTTGSSPEDYLDDSPAPFAPLPEPSVAKELREWSKLFQPFLNSCSQPEGIRDFVGATILRIHALLLKTSLESPIVAQPNPSFYDRFLPEFSEIVYLSRELVNHPTFVKSYVFDAGIVPVLFLVLTKCRDRMLRVESIEILKDARPRREGVWDAGLVAGIGEEIMRHEEREKGEEDSIIVHMQCLNISLELPRFEEERRDRNGGLEEERRRDEGPVYLLDWVERWMKMGGRRGYSWE